MLESVLKAKLAAELSRIELSKREIRLQQRIAKMDAERHMNRLLMDQLRDSAVELEQHRSSTKDLE